MKWITRLRANDLPFTALIGLEVAIILVGVLLAFAINEWRESRETEQGTQQALRTLAAEMKHNHEQVVRTIAYYEAMLEQIESAEANATEGEEEKMYGYELENWQGIALPALRSSTYNMLHSTGIIKDIEFNTATALASVYSLQSIVEELDKAMLARSVTDPEVIALPAIRHTFVLYNELLPSLLESYQDNGKPILERYGYDLESSIAE